MGFFSACFGRCSNRYKKIGRHGILDQKPESTREAQIADHLRIVGEKVDKNEDQLNRSARNSIGFDDLKLNLIVHEEEEAAIGSQIQECANQVAGGEREEGTVSRLKEVLYSEDKAEGGEQGKNQLNFPEEEEKKTEGDEGKMQTKEISDSSEKEEEEETCEGEMQWGKQGTDDEILSDSSESSLFTYHPTINGYKSCAGRDDDDDECQDLVDGRHAESDGRSPMIQEESSESLFSLSIDSRRHSFTPGPEGDKEVSSSPYNKSMNVEDGETGTTTTRDRTQYIDSVLNPIENLSQWKIVRRKLTSTMKNQEQENAINDSEELKMTFYGRTSNRCRNGVSVIDIDTSLSSWLVESEKGPGQENSPPASVGTSSLKDRPVVGALTMDELKKMSRHSSPRFNTNETPKLGTVGSYWRHTGAMQQQFQAQPCQSNTLQARLEEAMDRVE